MAIIEVVQSPGLTKDELIYYSAIAAAVGRYGEQLAINFDSALTVVHQATNLTLG